VIPAWWKTRDVRWVSCLWVLATWGLLQLVRSRFYLTDDSFTLFFPVWVDFGRKWFGGGDFWVCEWLFGGGYPLREDAVFLPLLHPFCLLFSFLAATPLQSWMTDLVCLSHLLLASWGFQEMLERLRLRGWANVGTGTGLFLGWSFAFCMYALLLGSSGFWYLANLSALPWLLSGLLEKRRLRSVLILALSVFHSVIGGYPSCFLYSMVGMGLLALWLGWKDRDGPTLIRNLGGMVLGGILALPLVWTPLLALGDSVRSGAIPLELASEGRLPLGVALGSVFFSSGSILFGKYELFGQAAHAYALLSFAGAGLFALAWFRPKRDWSSWDGVLMVALAGGLLIVTRPDWLGGLIAEIPIFRSLRWPHKEAFLVVFVLHLFAARGTVVPGKWVRLALFGSTLVFLSPLVVIGPPSFNEHALSRKLYFEGVAGKVAGGIRSSLEPGQQVVSELPDVPLALTSVDPAVPWVVLLSHNFPALWEVPGWAGYSATLPRRIYERQPPLANVFGHIPYAEDDRWTGPFHVAVLRWDPSKAEQVQLDLGEVIRVLEWDGEK
jgi:hypothetical protein